MAKKQEPNTTIIENNDVANILSESNDIVPCDEAYIAEKKTAKAAQAEAKEVRKSDTNDPVPEITNVVNSATPIWSSAAVLKIDQLFDFEQLQIAKCWSDFGVRGESVTVFVIDTGIDNHFCFKQHKIIEKKSFVKDQPEVKDGTGHGTWVASKIGGQGVGIAPRCDIVALQSLDESGTGFSDWSTAALKYVLKHPAPCKIVNMSLGSAQRSSTQDKAIKDLYDDGVFVVCAAGNNNTNQPFYPAASPYSLGVAAYDSSEVRASFSNYGSYVDISAHGVGAYGAYLGNTYRKMSGTSMASPIVTGIMALALAMLYPRTKHKNLKAIYEALVASATDYGAKGRDDYYGFGGISAYRFLERVAKL